MTTNPKTDIYRDVTDTIINQLEQGTRPWMQPWTGGSEGLLPLRSNGTPYRGVNVLLLWGAAAKRGFQRNVWMTYKQAHEQGAQVRKGERGAMVVYANRITTTEQDEDGKDCERHIPFLKAYTVFNVEQIDGLPPVQPPALPRNIKEPSERAKAFFASTGAEVRHGGHSAFYVPTADYVQMPMLEAFHDTESYCATLAHELTHWTGNPARLSRSLQGRFGSGAYAAEELIAEMGAAFLCAGLSITPQIREDHAAYLAHWLKVLKADKKAIFTAASQAQRASDYLHSLQPQPA